MEVIKTVLSIQNFTIGKTTLEIEKLKKQLNTEEETKDTLEKLTTLYKMKKQAEELKAGLEKAKEEVENGNNKIQE